MILKEPVGDKIKELGQYNTKKSIIDFILKQNFMHKNKNISILEPSSGSGNFIKALKEKGYKKITAYEIDKEYKNTGFVAILLEKSFYDRWETICTYLDVEPSLLAYSILESRLKELERELCLYQKADPANAHAQSSLSLPIPL